MANEAPDWLLTMRAISGLSEKPGAADEPKIMAMADEIARVFPEMQSYCDQYNHDSIPWCGLTVAYTMAKAGIRPPFGSTDTDKFLWAKSWADDLNYTVLKTPRLGCIVVLTRSGGGHVTVYESTSGSNYMCRGGNQSDAINLAPFPKSNVVALVWPNAEPVPAPIDPPADMLPMLRKGDTGPDVVRLQELLPKWVDGNFGPTTESLVKEFQRSQGLVDDGIVGEQTWAALLNEEQVPPIVVVPAPGEGWIHNITATWFGGSSETEMSAYPPYDRITANEISVALPYRFKGEMPRVEVMNEDGDIALAIIRDVGPWMIDDPYWEAGTRPIAEKCYASRDSAAEWTAEREGAKQPSWNRSVVGAGESTGDRRHGQGVLEVGRMIIRIIVGVVTVICTLAVLWWLERTEAHSQVPELKPSVYDRKLDRLDRRGVEAAYTSRVGLLFQNWMTDTNQASQDRALRGHRNAREIYIKVMTGLDARSPEEAEK